MAFKKYFTVIIFFSILFPSEKKMKTSVFSQHIKVTIFTFFRQFLVTLSDYHTLKSYEVILEYGYFLYNAGYMINEQHLEISEFNDNDI